MGFRLEQGIDSISCESFHFPYQGFFYLNCIILDLTKEIPFPQSFFFLLLVVNMPSKTFHSERKKIVVCFLVFPSLVENDESF